MIDDEQDEIMRQASLGAMHPPIPDAPKTDPAPGRAEALSWKERVRAILAREGVEEPSQHDLLFAGMGLVHEQAENLRTYVMGEVNTTNAILRSMAAEQTAMRVALQRIDAELIGVDLELGGIKRDAERKLQSVGGNNGRGNGQ